MNCKRILTLCFVLLCTMLARANAQPPAADRIFWLAADTNLTTDAGTVTAWGDAGTGQAWVDQVVGAPQLAMEAFPTGPRSVIRFDGDDGFDLQLDALARIKPISIYAVASIDTGLQGAILVANYRDVSGFGLGISDSASQRIKWFTAPPGDFLDDGSAAFAESVLTVDVPYVLTATQDSADNKTLGVWSEAVQASNSGVGTFDGNIASDTQFTLGKLDNGRQWWRGDIAEVLIYNSVSPDQDAAVQAYLGNKYLVPEPGSAVLAVLAILSWVGFMRRRPTA